MNQAAITAIGIATPPFKRSQKDVGLLMAKSLGLPALESKVIHKIYASSGIDYRYSVLSDYMREPGTFEFLPNDTQQPFPSTQERMMYYKNNAFNLAKEAVLSCMEGSVHQLQDITHLITVSCTGMYAPGLDVEIVQNLQLKTSVQRTAIQFMGCYGAFNAMKVANAIVKADATACVLIVSVELCTLHVQKEFTMNNIISNALFADGAGALVISAPKPGINTLIFESFFCDLIPQTMQEMSWHISNCGFEMVLTAYVPEVIRSGIFQFTERLLKQAALTLTDVDFYAIHPGGIKILQACEQALELTQEDIHFSYEILRQYGNMSSATIIFILHAMWQRLNIQDHGKRIFSCAFGPGLTLESMILRINNSENH